MTGTGRGWAVGTIYAGDFDPTDPTQGPLDFAVLMRLHDDTAEEVTEGEVQLPRGISWSLDAVAISPDGAHSWVSTFDHFGEAELREFTDPWVHWLDSPRIPELEPPLPGRGAASTRCPTACAGCSPATGRRTAGWTSLAIR